MKFDIDQTEFASALTLAQTVADRRSTMPILANVLLRADKGGDLECVATDMMIGLTERVPAQVSKGGSLSLGVRHLHEIVRALPGSSTISIEALDNHWARISTPRSEFKLMGMAEADFPELPDASKVEFTEVSGSAFSELVGKTLFSVSTDEARVNLNGALLESDGSGATMVSTDGHRLTKFSAEFSGPTLEAGIIVPRKGMIEIRKVLDRADGAVEIAVTDQHLFLRTERVQLSVKLNAVSFPPYDQVIPKGHERRAIALRSELVAALGLVKLMAPEKTSTVRLELTEGGLELTADNPDKGIARQDLPIEYGGDKLVAGFNAHYLLDALEAMDTEKVALEFQGELDPCVLRPLDGPDFLAVVMPMRI
jgi:DNA polymerase-3 subunit beta